MNWSLVPLMVGAIAFGWLGGWLQTRLAGPLGNTEALPAPITAVGMLAFVLGAAGFAIAWWYFTRRPEVAVVSAAGAASYRAAGWVRAIADVGYAISESLSRVQSGRLPQYALGSFVGLALIVLIREVAR
jgi:hypothetical protein